jgi:AAA+ superfamily predicted ATPase
MKIQLFNIGNHSDSSSSLSDEDIYEKVLKDALHEKYANKSGKINHKRQLFLRSGETDLLSVRKQNVEEMMEQISNIAEDSLAFLYFVSLMKFKKKM